MVFFYEFPPWKVENPHSKGIFYFRFVIDFLERNEVVAGGKYIACTKNVRKKYLELTQVENRFLQGNF